MDSPLSKVAPESLESVAARCGWRYEPAYVDKTGRRCSKEQAARMLSQYAFTRGDERVEFSRLGRGWFEASVGGYVARGEGVLDLPDTQASTREVFAEAAMRAFDRERVVAHVKAKLARDVSAARKELDSATAELGGFIDYLANGAKERSGGE